MTVKRISSLINVKPEAIAEYERVHAAVWPEVLATLHRCNVRNYSIFRYNNLLVSYMEYVGTDYEADMASIASDPKTKEWWLVTDPMQSKVEGALESEWWHVIPEVFHLD
ncbi:MAG: L-rhamnose mutarotase [Actinomycetes bacterium]